MSVTSEKKRKKIEVLSKASRIKKRCVHASEKETSLPGVALPPPKPKTLILVCLGHLMLCKETKQNLAASFPPGGGGIWRRRRQSPFGW